MYLAKFCEIFEIGINFAPFFDPAYHHRRSDREPRKTLRGRPAVGSVGQTVGEATEGHHWPGGPDSIREQNNAKTEAVS